MDSALSDRGQSAPGAAPIPFASRDVAAFVGRTERGPVDQAVTVRNFNHYRQVFGGHATFSFMSYAVQQYFLHGGKSAVIVRIANRAKRSLLRIPAGNEVLEVEARQPGSHEYIRVSIDYDGVESNPALFNLVAQRLSRPASNLVEDQEIFSGISVTPSDDRYMARAIKDSRLIQLRGIVPVNRPDATRPKHPGDPIPYLEAATRGTDGVDVTDYDIIGSRKASTGMFSLDAVERIDFLCLPPQPGRDHGTTTFLAAERYCEKRRALLIWDPPGSWESIESAIQAARELELHSWNAITYFPRICARFERAGMPASLPACGALAGILSHKATYGDWSQSPGAPALLKISLAPVLEVDESQAAALNRFGVNALVRTEHGSAALYGNVTLAAPDSAAGLWVRLDRRRLLWFILGSVERAGEALGDASIETLADFELRIVEFLEGLWARGALAGATPEQAFVVRSLASASPESTEAAQLRIGFAIRRPGEFLLYDLCVGEHRCSVRPAPALEAEQLAG